MYTKNRKLKTCKKQNKKIGNGNTFVSGKGNTMNLMNGSDLDLYQILNIQQKNAMYYFMCTVYKI